MAEKAISTFKDHFVGVLSGCAKTMPMHLWCQLLPQVERQLLLLRQSRVNPGMSAYAHVYQGHHDYNKHPFVPIGMEALIHVKPHKRRTYAQHCDKGYSIGTSFEHYRCQRIWMKDTHATRISGAVWFKHKYLTNPTVTPEDRIVAAIGGLAKTLAEKVPRQLRDTTLDKLRKLQGILEPQPVEESTTENSKNYSKSTTESTINTTEHSKKYPKSTTENSKKYSSTSGLAKETPVQTTQAPRVISKGALAQNPRIAPNGVVDEPPRVRPPSLPTPQQTEPRRSPRIAHLRTNKTNSNAVQPKETAADGPAQNTRSKRNTEERTILQETVLACIKTYVKVTQVPLQPARLAQRKFPMEMLNAVLNNDTGELMEMRQLMRNPKYAAVWGRSFTKELGRLAQGILETEGTNTIIFIRYDEIPLERRKHITYGKTVVTHRPEKEDPDRTRLTVGGNRISYPGDVSTPTVEMMTVKMHLNSVISTKDARYCTIDLKDFYLNTPMDRPEFMRMKLSDLPAEFVQAYNLDKLADHNGNVYIKVQKGMYGLPQAGILAHRLLEQRLNEHGYEQSTICPGLWRHKTRPISFTLCVDDFGVKYEGRTHVEHLLKILNTHYKCTIDWDGKKYLGMDIDWDYIASKVHVSMLDYVPEALVRFQHKAPIKPQHQPYPHVKPAYGATKQYAEANDTSAPLSKEEKTYVQEVIGTFLYYGRCVDASMLPALGTLATQQASPTENTLIKIKQFLDYAATHPDAIVTYNASDMVLAGHSDAS